jgi:nitroreductase
MNAPITALRVADHPVDPMFTSRVSFRAFSDEAMSEAEMAVLLEAARWAPSASNVQPWRFAWGLRGDAAFAAIHGALMGFNEGWAAQAAGLIVIASKTTRTASDGNEVPNGAHGFDAGSAWMSLALQAHMRGWVAHAMGGFDHKIAAAALNLPAGHALHAVVAVGRRGDAADLPENLRAREIPSPRLPLSAIAGRGTFPA